jgi:hypothetical protein
MAKKKTELFGITQDELETYRLIKTDAARFAADQDVRRKSLLARVEAGATVEPGPLEPQITTISVVRFTADAVAAIMGPAHVAMLRSQLKPVNEQRFNVVETEMV